MTTKALKFHFAVNNLLTQLEYCQTALDRLMQEGDLSNLVDDVSEIGGPVTVLEPLRLQVEMNKVLAKIKDLELVSTVQKTDPDGELLDEDGLPWYQVVKTTPGTVKAVKSVRGAFKNVKGARFDIADGRRIAELVAEGAL